MTWNRQSTSADWSGYAPKQQILQKSALLKLSVNINTCSSVSEWGNTLLGTCPSILQRGYLCVFARDVFSLSEKYSRVIRQHKACILGHVLEKRKTLIFIETIERGLQVFVAVAQPESGSRAVFVQGLFSSWLNPNCKIQQIICIIKHASLHPLRCKISLSAGYYYSSGCYFYVFPIPALYIVLSCSI